MSTPLRLLSAMTALLLTLSVSAQKTSYAKVASDPRVVQLTLAPDGSPTSIQIHPESKIPKTGAEVIIRDFFNLNADYDLKVLRTDRPAAGVEVVRFVPHFRGIRLQHGVYVATLRQGMLHAIQAEHYALGNDFGVMPILSSASALQKALSFVNARKYAWQEVEEKLAALPPANEMARRQLEAARHEYSPQPELVIAKNVYGNGKPRLAYRFNIYATQPLSRHYIYIDAMDGKVLLRDAIIKHATEVDPSHANNNRINYGIAQLQTIAEGAIGIKKPIGEYRFAPTGISLDAQAQTRYTGTRTIKTSQVVVPAGQTVPDPNNPNAPLSYSGRDPRIPVTNPLAPTTVYILRDDTRGVGNGTQTFDMNNVGGLPINVSGIHETSLAFVDTDNVWKDETNGPTVLDDLIRGATANGSIGANEAANDDIAIDAHWGGEMVYDYWKDVHNRLSYDNQNSGIRSYIHFGPAYDNAFWNGSVMTYGDGSGTSANNGFRPLMSLDVCGHEVGHGVCSFTSDLVYEKESGAMNEGLSDIWAAAVERYVKSKLGLPANTFYEYLVGEQIAADNIGLRRMDNPKAKTDPDTYGGRYWQDVNCVPSLANDQCGVHGNSGVLNKWFYLLVQGPGTTTTTPNNATTGIPVPFTDDGLADKPGANPSTGVGFVENIGNNYSLSALPNFLGLGFEKSEKITYLMELSLTPNSTFADARMASINAAKALYGDCSQEEITVTNAWFGVGIGAAFTTCTLPTLSVQSEITSVSEGAAGGCDRFKEYKLSTNLVSAQPSSTVVNFTIDAAGTTLLSPEYMLSTNSITYAANETGRKSITIRIYDDATVEGTETLRITASSALTSLNQVFNITVTDDDVEPSIGGTQSLLFENFESSTIGGLPVGWAEVVESFIPDPLGSPRVKWSVQSNGAAPLAYSDKRLIVSEATILAPAAYSNNATYNTNAQTKIVVRTPQISALGLNNIQVRFRVQALGEVGCSPYCDYGELQYSFDGSSFAPFPGETGLQFAGMPTDQSVIFNIPENFNGKQFFLGVVWYNDANAGAVGSITVDSFSVTARGRSIESQVSNSVSENVIVDAGKNIYFNSTQDGQLIARMSDATADLGCVTASIKQAGFGPVSFSGGTRTEKVVEITPTINNNASYSLTLYFRDTELTGFANPAALKFLKSNAPTINGSNSTNSVIVTPTAVFDGDGYWSYTATFNGFSMFAMVDPAVVLPVTLTNFSGAKDGMAALLRWTTASESNTVSFTVERWNGSSFVAIGSVAARGSSNSLQQYSLRDASPLPGANQYRLRITDRDGSIQYSSIARVSFDGKGLITLYPNPAVNQINVSLEEAIPNGKVQIINAKGQVVETKTTAASNVTTVPVSGLSNGVYLCRVVAADGTVVYTQKFEVRH